MASRARTASFVSPAGLKGASRAGEIHRGGDVTLEDSGGAQIQIASTAHDHPCNLKDGRFAGKSGGADVISLLAVVLEEH